MSRLWDRFKDNATAIGVFCVVFGFLGLPNSRSLGGFAKFADLDPVHQRFDAQDRYTP